MTYHCDRCRSNVTMPKNNYVDAQCPVCGEYQLNMGDGIIQTKTVREKAGTAARVRKQDLRGENPQSPNLLTQEDIERMMER